MSDVVVVSTNAAVWFIASNMLQALPLSHAIPPADNITRRPAPGDLHPQNVCVLMDRRVCGEGAGGNRGDEKCIKILTFTPVER